MSASGENVWLTRVPGDRLWLLYEVQAAATPETVATIEGPDGSSCFIRPVEDAGMIRVKLAEPGE